jgi:hypothetical protein
MAPPIGTLIRSSRRSDRHGGPPCRSRSSSRLVDWRNHSGIRILGTDGCGAVSAERAGWRSLRQGGAMTETPSDMPQPRDIALEQETPEMAADLEERSEPHEAPQGDESDLEGHPS